MTLAASFALDAANYVVVAAGVYTIVIIAYVITTIAFGFGLRVPYSRWSDAVLTFLRDVTEPYLRIFRRILPSFGGLDFSPLVAVIVLQAVARLLSDAIQS
ncbi:MAG: YggT family protein [Solirubrobacteraceae bacterium]